MFRPNQKQSGTSCQCGKPAKTRGFCQNCYNREYTTGHLQIRQRDPIRTIARSIFKNIDGRCNNPRFKKYEYYGGKGIKNELTVDDVAFLYRRDKADQLTQPSIDRKEADKNYTLENCRFIEFSDNRKNRKPKSVCRRCGVIGRRFKYQTCPECQQFSWCTTCKKPFAKGTTTICPDCRLVSMPCTYCGNAVIIDSSKEAGRLKNNHFFCSRTHQGKWIAKNFGWGTGHQSPKAA